MEFGSLIVVLFLFILSGLYILRPILVRTRIERRAGSTLRDALTADKERLLQALEELDLEFELDKISQEEHTRSRDLLLAEAAKVLKELDKLPKSSPGKKAKPEPALADDELDRMIAARREELKGKSGAKCPHCSKSVKSDAQYCSHCGGAL
jgi:hypothetical protein